MGELIFREGRMTGQGSLNGLGSAVLRLQYEKNPVHTADWEARLPGCVRTISARFG